MNELYIRIVETAVVIAVYLVLRGVILRIIKNTGLRKLLDETRGVLIRNAINVVMGALVLIMVLLIWGVRQSDLAVFIGSVLTVVGVAFFAQWSILSNVTASIIIFFNHPVKLSDSIILLEGKDYEIAGVVTNIGLFFITLESEEEGTITLPNTVFISKSIRNLSQEQRKE